MATKRSPQLEELTSSFKSEQAARDQRIKEFLSKNPSFILPSNSENTIMLYDVINGDHPVYIKTDNLGAAVTTGADHLAANGDLGLTLDGTGVGLAIWDGGRVRITHQEFGNRIQPSDGASSDNFHATHVAGTILASGVNPSAKGMATGAKARTFDFNNDDSEMSTWVSTDYSGIILSNHSYGTITGWYNGSWFGDTNISTQEDYLFGFYTSGAQGWDQLAHQ
ncbi:MAG: S8 family serine peptidase, partial [Cyclobacteriaceae bacterium]